MKGLPLLTINSLIDEVLKLIERNFFMLKTTTRISPIKKIQ